MAIFKRTTSLSILFAIILFSLSACNAGKYEKSDSVEQRIIFPQYFAVYDDDMQTTTVSAIFSTNNAAGPSLCLNGKSQIICNGEGLHGKYDSELKQYVYARQFEGQYIANLLFQYTNNEGNQFDNDIKIGKLNISSKQITISKSSGVFAIPFKGDAITDEEEIELSLGDEMISLMGNNHNIILSGALFADVPTGKYDGYFVRTYLSSDIKAMDRGGSFSAQYKTKKIKISIID